SEADCAKRSQQLSTRLPVGGLTRRDEYGRSRAVLGCSRRVTAMGEAPRGGAGPLAATGDADHALRLLRAIAELDETLPDTSDARGDVARAAAIVNRVTPGIDVVAAWLAGDNHLAVHVAGARAGLGDARLPLRLPFAPGQESERL